MKDGTRKQVQTMIKLLATEIGEKLKKQEQIAELVEESFKLKVESERLLEVAKKAVELAIEVDEEEAMKFIKENN